MGRHGVADPSVSKERKSIQQADNRAGQPPVAMQKTERY
jgi:hypothetical protein